MLTPPAPDPAPGRPAPARATLARDEQAVLDRERCVALLPRVSRTFALSIAALPEPLRDRVGLAYLLCRIVDTIEDTPAVPLATRIALFEEFSSLLVDDARATHRLADRSAEWLQNAPAAERELCQAGLPAVFRLYRALPAVARDAIAAPVLEMAAGMREHVVRGGAEAEPGFETLADLERYCYFVAGTVGVLLTALFRQHLGLPAADHDTTLRDDAISYGLGLQLVNVVKDIARDLERGACFLPRELMAAEGIVVDQLLAPAHRAAALRVVARVCARARMRLGAAARYTVAWRLPEGRDVRAFCAVPLGLALATLAVVESSDQTLRPGCAPKVDRAALGRLWSDAHQVVSSNGELRRWLTELGLECPPSSAHRPHGLEERDDDRSDQSEKA